MTADLDGDGILDIVVSEGDSKQGEQGVANQRGENGKSQSAQPKANGSEKSQYSKPQEGQPKSGSGKTDRNNKAQPGQQKLESGEKGH